EATDPHRDKKEAAERDRAQPESRQPSRFASILITAVVALTCGVIGAMGYSYFSGAKAAESSASRAKSQSGSPGQSSAKTKSGAESSAEPTQGSSTPATPSSATSQVGSAEKADELKRQISTLNQRIDQLGERIDRLQELLSLAVPLMQRIAPKN